MLGCLNRAKRPASRAEKIILLQYFENEEYQQCIVTIKILPMSAAATPLATRLFLIIFAAYNAPVFTS